MIVVKVLVGALILIGAGMMLLAVSEFVNHFWKEFRER